MEEDKTREKQVAAAMKIYDDLRLTVEGGYPSDYAIGGDTVYWASIDYSGRPVLNFKKVDDFIKAAQDRLFEYGGDLANPAAVKVYYDISGGEDEDE